MAASWRWGRISTTTLVAEFARIRGFREPEFLGIRLRLAPGRLTGSANLHLSYVNILYIRANKWRRAADLPFIDNGISTVLQTFHSHGCPAVRVEGLKDCRNTVVDEGEIRSPSPFISTNVKDVYI